MCKGSCSCHKLVLFCLLGLPMFVAIVSGIIGFLTLTEHGHWTAPDVPIVRQVVGGLQFVVTLAALIAVILAALGLKPGGSHLLLLYTVMMAVMMVVQLGFSSVLLGLVYAPNEVPAATRRELTQSLKTDSIELIDQVQMDYECCGVDNYSDWFNTTWSRDNQGLLAPESCCSKNEIWNNCSSVPDNIYAHGCLFEVMHAIHINALLVAAAAVALILIEGIAASISGHLYRTLVKYSKYNVL